MCNTKSGASCSLTSLFCLGTSIDVFSIMVQAIDVPLHSNFLKLEYVLISISDGQQGEGMICLLDSFGG
jgi:hypothetical protein